MSLEIVRNYIEKFDALQLSELLVFIGDVVNCEKDKRTKTKSKRNDKMLSEEQLAKLFSVDEQIFFSDDKVLRFGKITKINKKSINVSCGFGKKAEIWQVSPSLLNRIKFKAA